MPAASVLMAPIMSVKNITDCIPVEYQGLRIDKALSKMFPDYSRSHLQKWLKQGLVSVDDEIVPQKQKIHGGERIDIQMPPPLSGDWLAQAVALDIIYEDNDILVIDKPAGLVVHPGAGNPDGTLVNGLLYYDPGLSALPRAGIVHRLDKNTSGLLVVARNNVSRSRLIEQLQQRSVSRIYLTVVCGAPVSGGKIDAPIGRHLRDRRRMSVLDSGKPAITHYRIAEKFHSHALLRVSLETGRTHQIRVHMLHIGYPVFGDPVYSRRLAAPLNASDELMQCIRHFNRQALHARRLSFIHPSTQRAMHFGSPLPKDMTDLISLLRCHQNANA